MFDILKQLSKIDTNFPSNIYFGRYIFVKHIQDIIFKSYFWDYGFMFILFYKQKEAKLIKFNDKPSHRSRFRFTNPKYDEIRIDTNHDDFIKDLDNHDPLEIILTLGKVSDETILNELYPLKDVILDYMNYVYSETEKSRNNQH